MSKLATKQPTLASFEALVRQVKDTFIVGRRSIQQDVVHTYWQTGKYIHDHILHNQFRADYAENVIPRLSKRVGVSERSLREILQVYREFPEMRHMPAELSWTDFHNRQGVYHFIQCVILRREAPKNLCRDSSLRSE